MNKIQHLAAAAALLAAIPAAAAVPSGYYDSLEGKSGVALKKAVKDLVGPHTVIEYGEADPDNFFNPVEVATWTVFKTSDTRTVGGQLVWWDMYSTVNMLVADGHPGLNIEHSVAKSWWGDKAGSKEAVCDLYHLNPSNAEANGKKSNNPLGEVNSVTWTNGVTTTGAPKSGQGGGASTVFEPHDTYKGDFARAFFYIFTIYDDIPWLEKYDYMYEMGSSLLLKDWAYKMLLSWSAADPVSHKEIERNEVIASYQKNRNPFIDCPELADHIWGSKQGVPFHYAEYTPAGDDPDYPGWDIAPTEMVAGQWQAVTSTSEIEEGTDYVVVGWTKDGVYRVMSASPVSNNNAMDVCLNSPARDLQTYPDILTGIPADAAFLRLEQQGNYWVMGVYDSDGIFQGYLSHKSSSSNNTALVQNSSAVGCPVTITATPDKTVINFTDNTDYVLQYNENNTRFSSYKNTMASIKFYRPADEVYEDPVEDPSQSGVGTGLDETAPEVIIGIYDINGRRVNALSTRDLEKGIYIVVSNFGTRKILK